MTSFSQRLNPEDALDLFWEADAVERLIPPQVRSVTEKFNNTPYLLLHSPLQRQVDYDEVSQINYALLASPGDSTDTAVVHFNPFANGLTENMLLRAEYCRRTFRALGVRDANGIPLSVMTLAAPGSDAQLHLSQEERQRTSEGRFDALAMRYVSAVKRAGFKTVLIIGFSQGASLAAAAAAVAPEAGLQATHLAVGEPANIMVRPRDRLVRHFAAEFKHLKPAVQSGGIAAFETAQQNERMIKYVLGIAGQPRTHYALLKGLSKELFVHDLRQAVRHGTLVGVGYGGLSTVSPPAVLRAVISDLRREFPSKPEAIQTIEIEDAHHAWSDRLDLLATFYAYALMR